MKSSWLISIFSCLIVSCISIKPKEISRHEAKVMPVAAIQVSAFALFKASLDIKKHHLTGLLLVKRVDTIDSPSETKSLPEWKDENRVYRIVFMNEIGMTFFDLELRSGSIKMLSCFESLNKKSLLKILETDFRLLTGLDKVNPKDFYVQSVTHNLVVACRAGKYKLWQTWSPAGDTLYQVTAKSSLFDPVIMSCRQYSDSFPTKIILENPFIGMALSLRLLDRK